MFMNSTVAPQQCPLYLLQVMKQGPIRHAKQRMFSYRKMLRAEMNRINRVMDFQRYALAQASGTSRTLRPTTRTSSQALIATTEFVSYILMGA